jgi:hypothetical protein
MTGLTDPRVTVSPFARWVAPTEGERDAPGHRIIHGVFWDGAGETLRVRRVGVRLGQSYYYCGDVEDDHDWVRDLAAFALIDGEWMPVLTERDIPRPGETEVLWLDLPEAVDTTAFVVHVRRAGVGGWWSPWNVAQTGLALDAEIASATAVDRADPEVLAAPTAESITFTTGGLTSSFSLRRPSMTSLSSDTLAPSPQLLRLGSLEFILQGGVSQFANGTALRAVGRPQLLGGLRRDQGAVLISSDGESVSYESSAPGVRLATQWSPLEQGMRLECTLDLDEDTLFWNADVWSFCFDPRATPPVVYGEALETGDAGVTALPVQLDFPGFGELRLESVSGDLRVRTEVVRRANATNVAVQLAVTDDPIAGVRVAAGRHVASFDLTVAPKRRFVAREPRDHGAVIADMVEFAASSSLPYRQDTASLTNNGASQQVPLCLDVWGLLTEQLAPLLPDRDVYGMLRRTVERWLDGAPGYASGTVEMEESYVMTRAAGLAGVATYLLGTDDVAWFARRSAQIWSAVEFTRALDGDCDGLIESPRRLGISGEGQWASCWWDVVSFGHKDAFSNALLYPALLDLAEWYSRQGDVSKASSLTDWAAALRVAYVPTFLNPETGWLGGWRSPDDTLHDYAFLFVNGAAVVCGLLDDDLATDIVDRLVTEMDRVGFRNFTLGLPGNLRSIDDADLAQVARDLPFETYENGSATLSQARWFVEALYSVGRRAEADEMLAGFARGMLSGTALGGVDSGGDWRRWDGSPSGYEGILSDQFGVLIPAIREFGVTRADTTG